MVQELNEVVVVDAVRTAYGRAGEKGIFWNTRADDLCTPLFNAIFERNSSIKPDMIEDCIWGCTNQLKETGGNIGRMIPVLTFSDKGWQIPGVSVDRLCAGGLSAIGFGVTCIASGMADCIIAGGVEHMGHLPMGIMKDPHPKAMDVMGGPSSFSMGETAENLHEIYPEYTKKMADAYAVKSQQKAAKAIRNGKMKDMIIPIQVALEDGTPISVAEDQTPRPATNMEGLADLKTPFKENGSVTPGNASGLTDGAAAVLLMSRKKAEEVNARPIIRWVSTGISGVNPTLMGTGPVQSTQKALEKAGLTIDDIDVIELNEAFAVQCLHNLDRLGLNIDNPRTNIWGGSLAYGHPLAASGPRLVSFLCGLFKEKPETRYGLSAMCVGRGQGYSIIWESLI